MTGSHLDLLSFWSNGHCLAACSAVLDGCRRPCTQSRQLYTLQRSIKQQMEIRMRMKSSLV